MIPAIITVRTKSIRLPKKCLLPFGDGNILEHVIKRVRYYGLTPIISTTQEKDDDVIALVAHALKCDVYRGDTDDKLKRWLDTCNYFGIDAFYTADADDPFFCGNLAKLSYKTLGKGYDIVYPIFPAPYVGHMGFSLTTDILKRACQIKGTDKTEMMWNFIEAVPGVKILKYPEEYTHNIRLTLDYKEDYILLKMVLRVCGWDATKTQIIDFFNKNQGLSEVNWFRNKEWKEAQCTSSGFGIPA